MMEKLEVVYNGNCPVCSTEVAVYRKHAEAAALPIRFSDLHATDLARLGLTPEQAARRFHVLHQGEMLSGVPAFLVLWRTIPRYRWVGRIVGLPIVKQLAVLAYDHLAAPLLYAMHRRRVARYNATLRKRSATKPAVPAEASEHEKA